MLINACFHTDRERTVFSFLCIASLIFTLINSTMSVDTIQTAKPNHLKYHVPISTNLKERAIMTKKKQFHRTYSIKINSVMFKTSFYIWRCFTCQADITTSDILRVVLTAYANADSFIRLYKKMRRFWTEVNVLILQKV